MPDDFTEAIRDRMLGPCAFLKPHPDIDPGVYTTDEFQAASPVTGVDALTALRLPDTRFESADQRPQWRYGSLPLSELNRVDPFPRALSQLYRSHDSGLDVYRSLRRGEIPQRILDNLGASDAATAARELPEDSRDLVEPVADTERVDSIIQEWDETDSYWPPAVSFETGIIDGAHRVAALMATCPGEKEVFVWDLQG